MAENLVKLLTEETPTLIGIDHGFSFPLRYFEAHGLKHAYVDFVRQGASFSSQHPLKMLRFFRNREH